MSYFTLFCRRRFTVLDFKVVHFVAFAATVINVCTAHAQKRLFMRFRCEFRHRSSIAPPDILLECKISAIWQRFPLILPVCLTYWPRKYTTYVDHNVHNSHQVKSWYDHPLQSYNVFLPADTSLDLVTLTLVWPFDLTQLSNMVGHVQPCHQVWRPNADLFWFMSYNVSRCLPLKMRKIR